MTVKLFMTWGMLGTWCRVLDAGMEAGEGSVSACWAGPGWARQGRAGLGSVSPSSRDDWMWPCSHVPALPPWWVRPAYLYRCLLYAL